MYDVYSLVKDSFVDIGEIRSPSVVDGLAGKSDIIGIILRLLVKVRIFL